MFELVENLFIKLVLVLNYEARECGNTSTFCKTIYVQHEKLKIMFSKGKDNILAVAIGSSLGFVYIVMILIGLYLRWMDIRIPCSMDCGLFGFYYGGIAGLLFFPLALMFGRKYALFFKIIGLLGLGLFILFIVISVILGVLRS